MNGEDDIAIKEARTAKRRRGQEQVHYCRQEGEYTCIQSDTCAHSGRYVHIDAHGEANDPSGKLQSN